MSDAVHAALPTVVDGGTLSFDEARDAMGGVMDGAATPSQLAALLVALRMRGETIDELAGFAAAMRARVLRVEAPPGAVDTVGTGGDRSGTFNISTAAALVVAAAGVPVAKHGNRAITSRAGSADAIDALGIRIDHDAASAAADLRDLGFAFLFAPAFHPAMRHAGPTRREIGVRTAFNLLGPLTNPAGARRLVVGSATPRRAPARRRARAPRRRSARSSSTAPASTSCRSTAGRPVRRHAGRHRRQEVVATRYGLLARAHLGARGRDAGGERAPRRGRPGGRARAAPRRRPPQRGRGPRRRGPRRLDRGGDRASPAPRSAPATRPRSSHASAPRVAHEAAVAAAAPSAMPPTAGAAAPARAEGAVR